jgi:hypothetical protein
MSSTTDRAALSWCEERLLQPREPLRLARLFTPSARRDGASVIGALYIELEAIARGQRDLNVARAKLGWWREELARMDAGEPEHPATRLLAESNVTPDVDRLIDLVTCMELSLLEGKPDSAAEANERARRNGTRLVAVLNETLASQPVQQENVTPRRLARAIGLARMLNLNLAEAVHNEALTQARADLADDCKYLSACVPAVRVLAVLAWDIANHPNSDRSSQSVNARLRIFRAWRAARGKYPRELRKSMRNGRFAA